MRASNILLLFICTVFSNNSHADVIVPSKSSEYFDGGLSSSLELIYSLEKTITERMSVLLWGGGGFIAMIAPEPFDEYNSGFEGAIEFRVYPNNENNKRYFLGLYYGIGYLYGPERYSDESYTFTTVQGLGLKFGYKYLVYGADGDAKRLRFAIEPYFSSGATLYYQSDGASLFGHHDWHAYWVNMGIRFLFETLFR